ncbi:peptidoglycan-binding protein LysM [Aquincola sp. MAHUQ-54]|uniref:Potassium binding protein Kbp n=1 Tax=Aquincola agrisoli TaxID=3119538 RepID=A0AAW9Q6Q8_9BURK
MGLMSFIKEAGEKLLGIGDAKAAQPAAQAPSAENVAALNEKAAAAIVAYIRAQGLPTEGVSVAFDGANATVTVSGTVADQATKEKILLCCGNVQHVAKVNDELTVAAAEPASQWYTVVSGDNLSKIAKQFYGNPNKYPVIFEANKPMLTHPDKIYPGQMLRIPPAA